MTIWRVESKHVLSAIELRNSGPFLHSPIE